MKRPNHRYDTCHYCGAYFSESESRADINTSPYTQILYKCGSDTFWSPTERHVSHWQHDKCKARVRRQNFWRSFKEGLSLVWVFGWLKK